MVSRRNFIKKAGLLAGSTLVTSRVAGAGLIGNRSPVKESKKLTFSFRPYEVRLKHVFTLAAGSRTTTPVVFTEIGCDGHIGYGEASMPPYLGESHETVLNFLNKVDLSQFNDPFRIEEINSYIESIAPGNYAAKASVDIALHDLTGKLLGEPWYRLWGYSPDKTPFTSYTIGIDTPEVVREKTREASEFRILKVKLGLDTDKEMITTIRSVTDTPICVDVNQGWKDREFALEMIHWLNERNVVFVEQPMPVEAIDDMAWLTERSPLPTIADEALQGPSDIGKVYGAYDGINIKLMKCGGMRAARQMVSTARSLGMKVMIGCMIESSCAVTAAAQLSPAVDWADLDGNLLINNDVFEGLKIIDGRVTLPDRPGIGVVPL
ncbi:MAG: dipeptide epimerase [Marinilabiliales bacterium]|nr:MAG: dipeptide epimerase [Marinilabiliales bacterium]